VAATDARPIPRKNAAYRVTFPILDADGDLVPGASTPDSEVSIDGGTFADCINEATEIATSSGMYFLDLTAAEMNGDTVAVIVKTGTAGAKTTALVFYPEELGDVRVNVGQWNGTAVPTENTAGYPIVTIKDGVGVGELDTASGVVIARDHTGAALATAAALATVQADTDDIQTRLPAALVSGRIDASVGAIAANAITAASIAADAGTEIAGAVWTEALPGLYGAGTAGKLVGDNLNATVSSRAVAGDAMALTTAATAAAADKLLGRSIAGAADGGRTVTDALRILRNKRSVAAGTLTVTQENDTTTAWTAAVATTAGDPASSVDPV